MWQINVSILRILTFVYSLPACLQYLSAKAHLLFCNGDKDHCCTSHECYYPHGLTVNNLYI